MEIIYDRASADLVVIDLTNQNPNVYYEAGLAQAFGKQCIILAESEKDVTFDLKQMAHFLRQSPKHSNASNEIDKLV